MGTPALPAQIARPQVATLKRVPDQRKHVQRLEERVRELEAASKPRPRRPRRPKK
jgi:hypothetical protein